MAKYEQVKKFINRLIQEKKLKPGDKIPSENKLAKKCNVSRNTIRKAISEMVYEGKVYTKHGVGSFVSKKNTKTRNIGLITTYIDDYIFPSLIKGISKYLNKKNYSLIISHTDNQFDKEKQCLENMLTKNIEGLIIEPTRSAVYPQNIDLYNKFTQRNIPLLLIHGYFTGFNFSHIVQDDFHNGYLATKYLLKNNHNDILGIFKSDDIQGINRYKGFLKALREYEIFPEPESTIWYHTDDKDQKPSHIIKHIINNHNKLPSGIICYNDQIAHNIIKSIKDCGLNIPDDISVIGFDDSFLAKVLEPQLTSIRHPKADLGKKAAQTLLKLINNPQEKLNLKLQTELVKRNSVKKIKEK